MKYKLTKVCAPYPIRGGYIQPVNVTVEGCVATITTRYEAIGLNNILTLAHFPMTVIQIEYEI